MPQSIQGERKYKDASSGDWLRYDAVDYPDFTFSLPDLHHRELQNATLLPAAPVGAWSVLGGTGQG